MGRGFGRALFAFVRGAIPLRGITEYQLGKSMQYQEIRLGGRVSGLVEF